jgi:metalloreductase STEAP2
VCGNNDAAKNIVLQLASRIGFNAVDFGDLTNSSQLESRARRLFPGWGWPSIVVLVVAAFWIIFTMCRHFKLRKDPYSLERLPTNMANKMLGSIGATCLCFVFIPGCLAAFVQLAYGTKNVEFPRFLHEWLKMRQKLGLFALFFATLHLVMSEAIMSPAYLKYWFIQTKYRLYVNDTYVDLPITTRMNWMGETVILMGVLAWTIMIIMAITTIPSISRSLSWREWRYVHSHLGFVSVLLTACHLTVKGAPLWMDKDAKDIIPTITFLSCVLPWATIVMRLILYMPCVYRRVRNIRKGHHRQIADDIAPISSNLTDRELSIVV